MSQDLGSEQLTSQIGLQMRDQLATKAALKIIDHKKIQDKQRRRQRKTND